MIKLNKIVDKATIHEIHKDGKEIGFISEPGSHRDKYEITMVDWDSDLHGRRFDSLDEAKFAIIQQELYRKQFWQDHPELKEEHFVPGRRQNDYPAEVRTAFIDWVDTMHRAEQITDELAAEITL